MQSATRFRAPLWPKAYGPSAQTILNLLGTFMSKKSIYLASAALALFAAGNAYAIDLKGATGSKYATVNSAVTTSAAVKLADELRFTASASTATTYANSTDSITFNIQASAGNSLPTGVPLVLTVDLSNAIFNAAAASSGVLAGAGACTFTPAPLSGVQANATSASYLLTLSDCTTATADGIAVTLPVRVTGAGPVAIGAALTTQAGGLAVDGGRKQATFIQLASAYDVDVVAAGANATADLADGYEKLINGNAAQEVGSFTLKVDGSVLTDLTGAGTTASTASVAAIRLQAVAQNGFNGFNVAAGTATGTFTANTATISNTRTLDVTTITTSSTSIYVVDNTGTSTGTTTADIVARNAIIVPTALNLTATVDLQKPSTDTSTTTPNPFIDFAKSADLKSVVRNGASFVAPWVALGSSSANSTVRLANNGGTATGPIQATLLSHNGTSATTKTVTITASQIVAGSLNATGGIPAGTAVSISGAALKDAFGTDAANGDIQVSVEAVASTLSGKVRVTQASGQIFETSLGNLN